MAEKQEYDPKKETAAITEKALKGRGFVLFAAVLTDKKDKDGNYILDFHFTRHKYPFEDLRKASDAFRKACLEDIMGSMGPK